MNWIPAFVTALVTLFADRLSKYWAFHELSDHSITITSWFNFDLSWNKGVSWSLLTPETTLGFWGLTGIIITLIAFLAWYTLNELKKGSLAIFESMLFAAAVSNVIDRLMYGAVLDFIQWHWNDWCWPTFNVADAAIVCAVSISLFLTWWRD